ncbi:hypothetical protein GOV13_02505 [Candidatus Pacearchaeota archaeon]|nr:hypothetical protein [Candidatus Pacearchaeota archaeon]
MAKKKKTILKKKVVSKKVARRSAYPKLRNEGAKKKVAKKKVQIDPKQVPTLRLKNEHDIAMDFAVKIYKKFDKMVKSVVLFGSATKQTATSGSDIDIIILIDDVTINWDQELIAWYRTELDNIMRANPYRRSLHINTIKLSTWWRDLMRGDPVILNILRYGEAVIDMAGFFDPLKHLLVKGEIKSTPEAIYTCLQRAPAHITRSKAAGLSAIEGLHWSMVDSAHAALIAANVLPPSPEHIPVDLKEHFVDTGKLKMKYVVWYRDLLMIHKGIMHGKIHDLKKLEIDAWQERAEEFLEVMARLVKDLVS